MRFDTVVVFRRVDLEAAGVEIVPAFRTPHVTLCHASLDELVDRLTGCSHVVRLNPYHVGGEELDDGRA